MSKDRKKIFAANIVRLLEERGISQADLARASDFTPQEIWAWINGKYFPTSKTRAKLAFALNVSVEQLTNGNKPEPEELSQVQKILIRNLIQEELGYKRRPLSSDTPSWLKDEIRLEFPKKPENLTKEESYQWDMNAITLHHWKETRQAFNAPPWALEKFCRVFMGPYGNGKLQEITGILKGFIEGKK